VLGLHVEAVRKEGDPKVETVVFSRTKIRDLSSCSSFQIAAVNDRFAEPSHEVKQ